MVRAEASMETPGHLYIINGDLTRLACDAVLVPTDKNLVIESTWERLTANKRIPRSWVGRHAMPLERSPREPWVWLGNIGRPGGETDFSAFLPALEEFVAGAATALRDGEDDWRIARWPKYRIAVDCAHRKSPGVLAEIPHL